MERDLPEAIPNLVSEDDPTGVTREILLQGEGEIRLALFAAAGIPDEGDGGAPHKPFLPSPSFVSVAPPSALMAEEAGVPSGTMSSTSGQIRIEDSYSLPFGIEPEAGGEFSEGLYTLWTQGYIERIAQKLEDGEGYEKIVQWLYTELDPTSACNVCIETIEYIDDRRKEAERKMKEGEKDYLEQTRTIPPFKELKKNRVERNLEVAIAPNSGLTAVTVMPTENGRKWVVFLRSLPSNIFSRSFWKGLIAKIRSPFSNSSQIQPQEVRIHRLLESAEIENPNVQDDQRVPNQESSAEDPRHLVETAEMDIPAIRDDKDDLLIGLVEILSTFPEYALIYRRIVALAESHGRTSAEIISVLRADVNPKESSSDADEEKTALQRNLELVLGQLPSILEFYEQRIRAGEIIPEFEPRKKQE